MMAGIIRASCSGCGDVELRSRDLQVRICADTNDSTYIFRCPVCRLTEVKLADDVVIDILAKAGVSCVEWHLPAELAERPTDGEPISDDDVIDFHALLSDGDAWEVDLRRAMAKGEG